MDAQVRITRALTQRIFVQSWRRSEESWELCIRGTTDNIYDVVADSSGGYSCTCPDFERRQEPCKHIYNMVFKVAGIAVQDLEDISFSSLSAALAAKLTPLPAGDDAETGSKTKECVDDECIICFEELGNRWMSCEEMVADRSGGHCTLRAHTLCVSRLVARRCPMCRRTYKKV